MVQKKARNQNLTVPNLLSVLRIVVVPFFAYYFMRDNLLVAVILIGLSGLSDAVDGFIARRFNQITELGKILDPFADKITQGTVALCLALKYPVICPLLILFILKEFAMLVLAILLLKKQRKPCAARWYGKVATVLFYVSVTAIVTMSFLKVEQGTFEIVSYILLVITGLMMVYSAVKYFAIFKELLHSEDPEQSFNLPQEMKAKKQKPNN
ncbi:MAG: CDP-alcohol phosphatidyltransferase family protein [Oscillospiraceae bacterium]